MESGTAPVIGVIGGVGPYAGLEFIRYIFNNTRAVKDQDHLNCMLVSCPSLIPDRTGYLLSGGENPAQGLFESAAMLCRAGARCAVVACNTAHSERIFGPFRARAAESLPDLQMVNMLETCALHIKEESPRCTRIGLLATKGTHQSRVYHEYLREDEGFTLLEPEQPGREKIHEAIYNERFGIKAHSHPVKPQARNHIIYEIYRLVDRGAQAVILGCTELPLAVSAGDFSVPVIDPGELTARRLIALTAPEKLREPRRD
ncbi:MAG: amino acid racemase [Treponema sp.]|jgi:aspartate racemase|nr:amino acid racemase [Treponema sp.]